MKDKAENLSGKLRADTPEKIDTSSKTDQSPNIHARPQEGKGFQRILKKGGAGKETKDGRARVF